MKNSPARALHDVLVANSDGVCPAKECPFCHAAEGVDDPEEPVTAKTFTEAELSAEVQKAVAEATAPLQSQLNELLASQTQTAVDKAIADALAPVQAELAEVQGKLDVAVAEAKSERESHEAIVAYLEAEAATAAEAAEVAARKDERIEQVRETKAFDDEYVEENAERFAAMSADEFESRLTEWKAIAARNPANTDGDLPPKTKSALTAAEIEDGKPAATSKVASAISTVSALARSGSK